MTDRLTDAELDRAELNLALGLIPPAGMVALVRHLLGEVREWRRQGGQP